MRDRFLTSRWFSFLVCSAIASFFVVSGIFFVPRERSTWDNLIGLALVALGTIVMIAWLKDLLIEKIGGK